MRIVDIGLEDKFLRRGVVLISTTDFPINCAALSRTKNGFKSHINDLIQNL